MQDWAGLTLFTLLGCRWLQRQHELYGQQRLSDIRLRMLKDVLGESAPPRVHRHVRLWSPSTTASALCYSPLLVLRCSSLPRYWAWEGRRVMIDRELCLQPCAATSMQPAWCARCAKLTSWHHRSNPEVCLPPLPFNPPFGSPPSGIKFRRPYEPNRRRKHPKLSNSDY